MPNGIYTYQIYRQFTTGSNPGSNWTLVGTSSVKHYLDEEVSVGGSYRRAYYKVRAVFDDLYSDYSNYNFINYNALLKESFQETESITTNALLNNFPNPFNPSTKIEFSIAKSSSVTLKIFDSFGREISTLVNEIKPKGIHEVEFDARNLATGIYFYQLKTNSFVETKKMMLIK